MTVFTLVALIYLRMSLPLTYLTRPARTEVFASA